MSQSLAVLSDNLVKFTQQFINQAKSEEDLRINFEKILEPISKSLGITTQPKYEHSIFKSGRSDALHGQVVIEYEPPRSFKSSKVIDHALDQLIGYLQGLSQKEKDTLFIFDSKFIGVGFDGEQIFFVQYKGDKQSGKTQLSPQDFILIGPYEFNQKSAQTFLTHLRALSRLPLNPENLAEKFGPKSQLAPQIVSALADALENWGDDQPRVQVLFNEWKRLFGIVYGESFSGHQVKEVQALSSLYQVGEETDFQELLFSVHTYFALLMKLIAAELLGLRDTAFESSLSRELTHLSKDELKTKLQDIEDGGVYARQGITNFLEGDFFRWYLDVLSPRLIDAIQDITRALSEFEPATSTIAPEVTRDLLKKLYQYLVPQEVRHKLGEYYTPDWLAELVLNEVGYTGDTLKRLLDPACGSGTFLVLAIQRAKEYGLKQKWSNLEIAKKIVANIWGFDLNPLAVIAARTNYLFALGDLVNELKEIEIPIYLADSVLWPRQTGQLQLSNPSGEFFPIKTSVKEFHVPQVWLNDTGLLMKKAAPLVEELVKNKFEDKIALTHLKKAGLVFPPHEQVITNFYNQILDLEKQNKNGIWARFLKNAFAPMIAGKFDFVVGNPPWIRWGYLSEEYRSATLSMWKDYGLFSLKGNAARLGGGEKDFSMLFTYAASDYYLNDGSKLGFLITQEVLKSKGAGEGFRRFQIGKDGKFLKVLKAHDFSTVQPFEGATNKTAAIFLTKGLPTKYPVPYTLWTRIKGVGRIPTDSLLNKALSSLNKAMLIARPVNKLTGSWQTIKPSQKGLSVLEGKNNYKAHQGADTQPYGVFLLGIKNRLSNGDVLIKNLIKSGKFETQQVEARIESDLVYPAIKGSDIKRWGAKSSVFLLMTQNPESREPFKESIVKDKWPQTYSYLTKFKSLLLSRQSKSIRDLMDRVAFYSMFGIGPYTISRYKVVWKFMTDDMFAAVVSQSKSILGYKIIIPTKTVALFSTGSETEAHYLCAILNSNPVRDFIKSFSSAGRGFGSPSIMENLGISKYDPQNKLHQRLAEISKQCHELKLQGKDSGIEKLEKQNDELVIKLFSSSKSKLNNGNKNQKSY